MEANENRDLDMTDVTLDPLCSPRRSCGARSESESAQQCVSSDHVVPTHNSQFGFVNLILDSLSVNL